MRNGELDTRCDTRRDTHCDTRCDTRCDTQRDTRRDARRDARRDTRNLGTLSPNYQLKFSNSITTKMTIYKEVRRGGPMN